MKIGLDVDGVLANFSRAFAQVLEDISGKRLLPAGPEHPNCWCWPEKYGWSGADINRAWSRIRDSETWWLGLEALENVACLPEIVRGNDVYFITHRRGRGVKRQTEQWLEEYEVRCPTVLCAADFKYPLVRGLGLELYVDDDPIEVRRIHISDCGTRTYLLLGPHNMLAGADLPRIASLREILPIVRRRRDEEEG